MCPLADVGDFSAARVFSMQDPEAELRGHADAIQRCLTCAACEERCPQGVRYTDFVRALRPELPAAVRVPSPHGEVFQIAARPRNKDSNRWAWLEADDSLRVADEGELALFVGCLPLFDAFFGSKLEIETVEIARAAIRLLNRLGIEPVLVTDECCCGHDLLWRGDTDAFETLAKSNLAAFEARGIQQILTVCAECARTWRTDYTEVLAHYQPRVEHLSEFLAARLDRDELSFRWTSNGAVTYQDPCRLGRQLGVFDPPRELLRAVPGSKLTEMERSGADALCCGTAGFIRCDAVSRQLQCERLESAASTGASKLITACPKCMIHFRCTQQEDSRRQRQPVSIEVEDLTVFMASQLEDPTPATAAEPTDAQQIGDPS
jgi:Fe-S oxidoreductase